MRSLKPLVVVGLLVGCSAMWAQTAPTLVVTGTGSTSSQLSGDYYGSYDSNPFTLSAAQPSVTPADNFNVTGSFASSSATLHVQGNVVFGQTVFNFCPYSFCTWVYSAGATLNISLQGTPGTDYAIDITRTASMSTATADPDGAYSASADSTSVNTQSLGRHQRTFPRSILFEEPARSRPQSDWAPAWVSGNLLRFGRGGLFRGHDVSGRRSGYRRLYFEHRRPS